MDTTNTKDRDTSIKSWWKKKTKTKNSKQDEAGQIFGVPLEESISNAHAAIAYADDNVQYMGHIPLLIAKCGSFLKEEALYTEGIFRMSGSAKRIGQLQQIFNTAPDYGRQLDWKGYSVHDTANILRRFLNYLPEPVIVQELYQPFRETIERPISDEAKVEEYQALIEQLPPLHQCLLFYLLDLLFLFSQNGHITKMDTFNLASVFTPGILMDPECSLDPSHYKTSQRVVQFLIEHQLSFQMPKASFTPMPSASDDHHTIHSIPGDNNNNQLDSSLAVSNLNTTPSSTNTTVAHHPLINNNNNNNNNNNENVDHSSKIKNVPSLNNINDPRYITQSNTPIYTSSPPPILSSSTSVSSSSNLHSIHLQTSTSSIISSTNNNSSNTLPKNVRQPRMYDDRSSYLHRSHTVPLKRSKYGDNDPIQVVQFNKPLPPLVDSSS
ncbi:Rho GTPase activation protein [Cunninghamella echinulata]|nr:Rho GTPase activation protein [Cunninghamella echinulata]